MSDRWSERRARFAARRAFARLISRSSLAEEELWVVCTTHGRQPRDPKTGECIACEILTRESR